MSIRRIFLISILALSFLSQGFAEGTAPAVKQENPIVTIFSEPISDPISPFNRAIESTNSFLARNLLSPLGRFYTNFVPDPVLHGIGNVTSNLLYPMHALSLCLSGRFNDAWTVTKRFGINTTVGLLGWFDPASHWNIKHVYSDFGMAFASWGIPTGCYINVPILGGFNAREAVAFIPNWFANIATYLPYAGWITKGNLILTGADFLDNYFSTYPHTYPMTRAFYVMKREALSTPPKANGPSDPDDSLGIVLLVPKDPKFINKARHRRITLPGVEKKFNYTLFPQEKSDGRILFILPGIGAYRSSQDLVAIAEIAYNAGWSIVIPSSTMHPDYLTGAGIEMPGLLHNDVKTLSNALKLVQDDAYETLHKTEYKYFDGIRPLYGSSWKKKVVYNDIPAPRVAVLGFSLGAINTMYLAAADGKDGFPFKAERYIAVNPPRNPFDALKKIDDFFDLPLTWPEETRMERTRGVFQRLALFTTDAFVAGNASPLSTVPITREESQMLIGLNIHMKLFDILSHLYDNDKKDVLSGVIRTDTVEHFEHDAFALSWQDYFQKIVYPNAIKNGLVPKDLPMEKYAQSCTIDALVPGLKAKGNIIVIHTENDPLLNVGDAQWFKTTFGERCILLPRGGHLGFLYTPEAKDMIRKMIQSR